MRRSQFERLVERAIRLIPAEFRARFENLAFLVEDWADAETLASVGFEYPEDLLGYYAGTPLSERSIDRAEFGPDVIILYQGAIEFEAQESGLPVQQVLRETLIHEVAHYFGFSETEMDRIEALWAGEGEP